MGDAIPVIHPTKAWNSFKKPTYQIPSAVLVVHQRSAGITLTGVLAPVSVSSAEHLLVDDHIDAVLSVPAFADPVLDHWHIHRLERLGPETGARIQSPPAGGPAEFSQKIFVLLWQANGCYKWKLITFN